MRRAERGLDGPGSSAKNSVRRMAWLAALLLTLSPAVRSRAEIVDRVVARVGNEIVTLGDMLALRRYQELLAEPGAPDSSKTDDRRLLDQLVEQQVILEEASTLAYTPMSAADVQAEIARLGERLGSPEAFEKRRKEVGLSEEELRWVLTRQGNIQRFLDARFRAAVQLPEEQIASYYREQLLPQLHRRGVRQMPELDEVEDQIRELLTQQQINEMVSNWLVELKARTRIQVYLEP